MRTSLFNNTDTKSVLHNPDELGRSYLLSYAALMWPGYKISDHHLLIANHLEKIEKGQLSRLIITMPPRAGKSLLVSELFPAWYLGRNPDHQIIAATYSHDKAGDCGRKIRNQLIDPEFHKMFPECQISPDSKGANKLSTLQGGVCVSVGINGAVTGRGAHCLPAEIIINTNQGPIKISDIVEKKLNDFHDFKVLSWSNRLRYNRIIATRKSYNNTLFRIVTKTGIEVKATGKHKFYIDGEGYKEIEKIQPGDRVLNISVVDVISSIEKIHNANSLVYDLQVERDNNFFANQILCHNCFLIDDPIKSRQEADSDLIRERLKIWYKGVAFTRMMEQNAIVIVMTRWHFDDLVGWLLERDHEMKLSGLNFEPWTVLDLPAIMDSEDNILVKRGKRKVGDSIWPGYKVFDLGRLAETKEVIGSREWNSQYMQRPLPEEGGMVQLNWFQRYKRRSDLGKAIFSFSVAMKLGKKAVDAIKKKKMDPLPDITKIVISWDTAFKESELNDPSAGTVWGIAKNGFYLLDVINKHMDYPKLKKTVIGNHEFWNNAIKSIVRVLIEDKASGQSLIQDLKQNTKIPVIAIPADASKQVRLSEVTALIESGRVFLPEEASWLVDVETQMCQFPYAKHDDIVDSISQFLRWAGKPKRIKRKGQLFWK